MTTPGHLPRHARGRRARAAGFTLIEVMVALAIVAIALAAGSRAASSVVDTSQRLSDVMLAQWCADNQLADLRLNLATPGSALPPVGDEGFTCNQLGRTFKGTLHVQSTPNPNFRRVDAIVLDDENRPLLTISTVVSNT